MKVKIVIETVPITPDFRREKRIVDKMGECYVIDAYQKCDQIRFFTLLAGKDFFRGGHYHKKRTEYLFVLRGTGRIEAVDVKSLQRVSEDLAAGEKTTIEPYTAHRLFATDALSILEYYPGIYQPDDNYPFESW